MSGVESAMNAMVGGIQGLNEKFKAHSQNIAAASVVSAKQRSAFLSSLQTDSSSSVYTPSGIAAKPVVFNDTFGGPIPSSTKTFLAIARKGYFVTSDKSSGNSTYSFTRLGTFNFDKDGNLVNHVGQFLLGFPTDSNGNPVNSDVSTFTYLKSINSKNLVGTPQATTQLKLPANLPATTKVGDPSLVFPTTVYDSLGLIHTVNIVATKTAESAGVSQTWKIQITTAETGVTIGTPYSAAGGMSVVFDPNGVPLSINGATAAAPANNSPALTINYPTAAAASNIAVNFGSIGLADGLTCIGNQFYQGQEDKNGVSLGQLTGIEISPDGLVVASFNNGSQLKFAKVPIATFDNVNGLIEQSGNMYVNSLSSGAYRLHFPKTGDAGEIVPGALEQSTIDTAGVYTEMLVDEKRYVANIKGIQIVNKMMDKLEAMVN